MSIYKSQKGREKSLELYDRQLLKLWKHFSDIYVETTFGKTHIVETGNFKGIPVLVFHGGNSTSAYNLLIGMPTNISAQKLPLLLSLLKRIVYFLLKRF